MDACVCESFDLLIEPFALSFCPSKSFPVSGHFRHFLGLMRKQALKALRIGWELNMRIRYRYRMQENCHIVIEKDISGCLEPETRFISSQEQNRVINLEGQEMIN